MNSRPATSRPPAGALRPGWWAPGLALAERPAPPGGAETTEPARARVAGWRAAFDTDDRFDQRLAAIGLNQDSLRRLVAEPPEALSERVERPAWAGTVERAMRLAEPRPVDEQDWRAAFAAPLRPFVELATAELIITATSAAPHADLPAITPRFAKQLSGHLVRIATRTFVHELNTGTAGSATDFARRLTEPAELAALLSTYPVLARLLAQASTFHAEATAELLTRFAADRHRIVHTLLGATDPGPLADLSTGLGDGHQHGRSVAILSFADGRRVVYKPRDLTVHRRFIELVDWLNGAVAGLGLRTVSTVARDGYGWLEHIDRRPLADLEAADRFYRRQGALLALLYAVNAADIHFENVIACGDQPVLIDVETLLHPTLAAGNSTVDPAARLLSQSVQRTGLLPILLVGDAGATDVSGLSGATVTNLMTDWQPDEHGALRPVRRAVEFTGRNRPRLDGRDLDVAEHERALHEGFQLAYDAIRLHRAEFTGLVKAFAGAEVRVAVRHSRGYANLLDESTRPDLLRDALDRDAALDLLWTESRHHPLRWRACPHEQADLWALDIPVFTTRPESTDLYSSAGRRLACALAEPSLAATLSTVDSMSEVDRRDQRWIISAALAARTPVGPHRTADPMPATLTGTAAPPERLLAASCALADQIVARTLTDGDRVNWLGLELVDDQQWMLLPMGAGLGTGYLGVALFLAQLAEVSGVARYADVARGGLRAVPELLDSLIGRPDLVAAIGCGGFTGFGGIAYGLGRLATLLADECLLATTSTAVGLATLAARTPGRPGIAAGSAGCLAAMTAVHAEHGIAEAARLAACHATRLAELVRRTGGRCGPYGGFAAGSAGIGWALSGHDAEAARLAVAAAHAPVGDPSWCSGAAGLAVAGTDELAPLLADRPVPWDLSLCHGELGIAEALTVLGMSGDRTRISAEAIATVRRRRAGLVLDAITQYGPGCGTPRGVPTPGLLNGLAGIGYGLLRLGYPERIPSILLFEPSPTSHAGE